MKTAQKFVLAIACLVSLVVHVQPAGLPDSKVTRTTGHVTIVEFADFQCPFCARQASDLRKLQAEYPKQVELVFKNFPLSFHKRARAAHRAALAAQTQSKFWEMHDLIFAHPGKLSDEDFDSYAHQLGLDAERFDRDREGPEPSAIGDDIAEGMKLGVTGTPTFFVNGRKMVGVQSYPVLKAMVEAAIKGEPWHPAEVHGAAIRAPVNTLGAPSLGSPSAKLTIVEFADFQCPFCAKAFPWLKQLLSENPGNVRLVFKNFPLSFHADSSLAHRAAMAAAQQGKFWEMHDLIFTHQRNIKRGDLLNFASKLNLDMAKFERDLSDEGLLAKIQADQREGTALGVTGTPAFVINGELMAGFPSRRLQEIMAQQVTNPVAQSIPERSNSVLDRNLSFGPADAPIKVEWYADLDSPLTAQSAVALQQFLDAHPGAVQVRFRNFPLPGRNVSMLLHQFALAAANQGKFWSTEALLLADPNAKTEEELHLLANQLGLDQDKLWAEVKAQKYLTYIEGDLFHAKQIGITGTPTFVVDRKKFDGVNGLQNLNIR